MLFKKKAIIEKSVAATLYPDRIIIVTRNNKNEFIWYSTDFFTSLDTASSDELLGNTVVKHLDDSKHSDISDEAIRSLRESFRKLTRLKTEKAVVDNARYVNVFFGNNKVRFEPYKTNMKEKTFYRIPEGIITIEFDNDKSLIGRFLKKAWDACIIE